MPQPVKPVGLSVLIGLRLSAITYSSDPIGIVQINIRCTGEQTGNVFRSVRYKDQETARLAMMGLLFATGEIVIEIMPNEFKEQGVLILGDARANLYEYY